MSEFYDHVGTEEKWRKAWDASGIYDAEVDWDRPKHYAVTMLPYPSGDLHIGHWYAMTPPDARARYMRMKGYNVLFPMGFDAFGLPAENAAVQRNIHPWKWTYDNIERMRDQMKMMGTMIDWRRETISSTPQYYHWTEWFFKRLFEGDLAYRGEALVNWSPTLQTVLANEQVIDGKDERTGQPVVQKMMVQWFFRISKYADELLEFGSLDWPDPIKAMQSNWIGRSEGARIRFATIPSHPGAAVHEIEVFTTRPDTLFGATFMVLSPEHPLVGVLTRESEVSEVEDYKEYATGRSELERSDLSRTKTGVFTGGYVTNPASGTPIPVWIADYVLMSYGTGAIMAVPGQDERDWEFAEKFGLSIIRTVQPPDEFAGDAYLGEGQAINSGFLDGLEVSEAKRAIIDWLEEQGHGASAIQYRLRDWLISRQRYWGSPIPMVYRADGVIEAVPDDELPVELPEDVDFMPTGRSPLTYHGDFLNTTDVEGEAATRETDTMDTFMCSSWYQLRYLSPDFDEGPWDPEEAAYWLPVDTYTGGAEHAVMHLMYTRFFTKALRDLGLFEDTAAAMKTHGRDPNGLFDEPMLMLRNQGQVLGEIRDGDVVSVEGEAVDGRIVATSVTVVEDAGTASGEVVGELMRRTENVLQVAVGTDGETVTVEIGEGAAIEIPALPGINDVTQLRHHLDVERMSKSRGNTANPDDLVQRYGADTVRTYLFFAFEWEKGGPWDSRGIKGAHRFITDVWRLSQVVYRPGDVDQDATAGLRRQVHKAITKVGDDLEAFRWNTAVAELMKLRNSLNEIAVTGGVGSEAWNEALRILAMLLAPIAPFVSEELWLHVGDGGSVHLQSWPTADASVAADEVVTMVVQVNGKVRARFEVPVDISEAEAVTLAKGAENVQKHIGGRAIRSVIARQPRLINIVV